MFKHNQGSKKCFAPPPEGSVGGGGGGWTSPSDKLMEKIGLIENAGKNICLLFSPYNGEQSGVHYDFLLRLNDYHYQSSELLNFYCIGYDFDGETSGEDDHILISQYINGCRAKLFLHRQFHEIRREVYKKLQGKVGYVGGIEMFLFPLKAGKKEVDWSNAVLFSTSKLTPDIFTSSDEMIRYVIELSHHFKGEFLPTEARKELRDKVLKSRISKFSKFAAGPAATLLAPHLFST